jgi:regulatory protein
LDRLAAEGLQDDGRFTEAYIAQRARRGYGPRRITAELRARGIDPERINEGLAAVEFDWRALARDARNKKFNEPPHSMMERAQQTRFLEYRGFFAEHIRHALGLAVDDENF